MKGKVFFLLVGAVAAWGSAWAQQRSCDMTVTLVSPASGAIIPAFTQFDVRANVQNLGPNDLIAGDTLYFNTSSMVLLDYDPYVLTQNIPSGQSLDITFTTVANFNDNSTDQVLDYCLKVVSSPLNNGIFADPDLSNNASCNSITLKPQITGIGNSNINVEKLQVYPNPATSSINVLFQSAEPVPAIISVYDITGRQVLRREISSIGGAAGNVPLQVDVANISPGLYIIHLGSEERRAVAKFVKH